MRKPRSGSIRAGAAAVVVAVFVGGLATYAFARHEPAPSSGDRERDDKVFSSGQLAEATTTITAAADEEGWPLVAVSREPDDSGLVVEVLRGHQDEVVDEIESLVDVPVEFVEVDSGPIERPVDRD